MATVLFLMFCMYLNVLSKDGIEGITQWPGATVRSDFSPQGRDLHLMSPSSSEIDGDAPNLNELEYRPALRRFRTDTVTTIKDKEKDRLDGAAPPHDENDRNATLGLRPKDALVKTTGNAPIFNDEDDENLISSPITSGGVTLIDATTLRKNITSNSHGGSAVRLNMTQSIQPLLDDRTSDQSVIKELVDLIKNATRPDDDATGKVTERMKTTKNTMLVP